MMYEEFRERTNKDASISIFEKFEPMYMAGDMDKDAFCEMIKPSVDKMVKEEKDMTVRKMVRVGDQRYRTMFNLCIELGRDIRTGRIIVKNTGYRGFGDCDYTESSVRFRKGIIKITKAEREEISMMDVRNW